ncbi:MAG: hypothetical protein QXV17_01590 [Candidatus Micrarchaeaceae archaeon]
MKRILWFSKNELDPKAVTELKNKYGDDVTITRKHFPFCTNGFVALQDFYEESLGYNLVGGDLPVQLWLKLRHASLPFGLFVIVYDAIINQEGQTVFVFDHIEYDDFYRN